MNAQPITKEVKQPTIVTAGYLIKQLIKYTLERKVAYGAYPNAKGASEKLLAIDEVLYALAEAGSLLNDSQIAKAALRQTLNLHFIAPAATRMVYQRWRDKIDEIMDAFREFLGWEAQQC